MIKAVIFDCFGVLLADSLQLMTDGLAESKPAAAQEVRDTIRLVNKGLIDPSEARPRIAECFEISVDEYSRVLRSGETKNTKLLDYIQDLHGSYKTAVLSNVGADSLRKRFPDGELATHFDAVVASGDIGFAKPEPQAYEITATRLGVRLDECVFTDDRIMFCEAATSVGMKSILYTDFVQFAKELEDLLARENS